MDQIQDEFKIEGEGSVNGAEWARKFLVLWLVEDHGQVNARGHGMPTAKAYKELPTEVDTEGPFRAVNFKASSRLSPSQACANPIGSFRCSPQKCSSVTLSCSRFGGFPTMVCCSCSEKRPRDGEL